MRQQFHYFLIRVGISDALMARGVQRGRVRLGVPAASYLASVELSRDPAMNVSIVRDGYVACDHELPWYKTVREAVLKDSVCKRTGQRLPVAQFLCHVAILAADCRQCIPTI